MDPDSPLTEELETAWEAAPHFQPRHPKKKGVYRKASKIRRKVLLHLIDLVVGQNGKFKGQLRVIKIDRAIKRKKKCKKKKPAKFLQVISWSRTIGTSAETQERVFRCVTKGEENSPAKALRAVAKAGRLIH